MNSENDKLGDLWPGIRPLLRSHGETARIFVLDLPTSEMPRCIELYANSTIDPAVETLNDRRFSKDSSTPPFRKVAEVLYAHTDSIGLAVMNGTLGNGEMLNLWLKRNEGEETFDAELVFWADQICRTNQEDADHRAGFQPIFEMAEQFRHEGSDSVCLLSIAQAGDPRAELDEPWTISW